MVWIVNDDRTATWVEHLKNLPEGVEVFATLAGAARQHNIQCSAFEQPIRLSYYYNHCPNKGWVPNEAFSEYRVQFFNGLLHYKALHLSDVRAAEPFPL
jgi:hypothetical protein